MAAEEVRYDVLCEGHMINQGSESGFHFLQDWHRCKQYWYNTYRRQLAPKNRASALDFGTAIHEAMAEWYRGVRDRKELSDKTNAALAAFNSAMAVLKPTYYTPDRYEEDLFRGNLMLQEYAIKYAVEPWRVLAVEEDVQFTFPETGDVFTGRIDLVVEGDSRRYIVDHKTTAWNIASLNKSLMVSDQGTGYLWVWNDLHPDMYADGIIFNILRNVKGTSSFHQVLVIKTQEDLDRFKRESRWTLDEIAKYNSNPSAVYPRNTQSCFLYNRQCPFYDLCMGFAYEEGLKDVLFKDKEKDEDIYADY